jgi:hypothetical protein
MGVGSAIAFFVFAILVPIAYMAAIASGSPQRWTQTFLFL